MIALKHSPQSKLPPRTLNCILQKGTKLKSVMKEKKQDFKSNIKLQYTVLKNPILPQTLQTTKFSFKLLPGFNLAMFKVPGMKILGGWIKI